MSRLEGIIRPFQQPDRLTRRRIVATNTKLDVNPVSLTWGEAGNLPVPQTTVNFTVKKEKDHIEISRETELVRIENPDDPSQYVMVERPKNITFREKGAPTYPTYPNTAGASGTPTGQNKGNTEYVYPPGDWVLHPVTPTPGEEFVQYAESPSIGYGITPKFRTATGDIIGGDYIPLTIENRRYLISTGQLPDTMGEGGGG